MRVVNTIKRFNWFFKTHGLFSLLNHIIGRFIKPSRFQKFCSSVDLRNSNVKIAQNPAEFISFLYPKEDLEKIKKIIKEAEFELSDNKSISSVEFPSKWNSGRYLQIIIFAIARLTLPTLIVETGTANGASANSWSSALRLNGKGKLVTVDIKKSKLPAVEEQNLPYIECEISNGNLKNLSKILRKHNANHNQNSIFLHDSDHSYFGQYSDYQVAVENKFNLLLSDDIDASLAFIDFTKKMQPVVLFDERKFIGGVNL
jgi:hypothetical protein